MVEFINCIVNNLKEIPEFNHVQIWNSQFDYLEEGGSYSFPFPCVFVEIITDEFGQLGNNYQGGDVSVNIHLGNDFYNGCGFDDNLDIYTLRDLAVKKLNMLKTPLSGVMFKISETPDYNHSNVYHYIIQYKCHIIDDTAVNKDILTTPPTALIINK